MAKRRLAKAVWIGQGNELDGLLEAANAYILANGGKVVVIGPVELQKWPEDNRSTFRIAVRFTGKPPQKPQGAHRL
jgi:hypothetical protein